MADLSKHECEHGVFKRLNCSRCKQPDNKSQDIDYFIEKIIENHVELSEQQKRTLNGICLYFDKPTDLSINNCIEYLGLNQDDLTKEQSECLYDIWHKSTFKKGE